MTGSLLNKADCVSLEINRGKLPRGVQLYVDLMDRRLLQAILEHEREKSEAVSPATIRFEDVADLLRRDFALTATLPSRVRRFTTLNRRIGELMVRPKPKPWKRGVHEGREVLFLASRHRVVLPICAGPGRYSPIVIGSIVRDDVPPGEYEVVLIQRQPDDRISGSATLMIRVGKEVS